MCYRTRKYTVFEASLYIFQSRNSPGWDSEGVNGILLMNQQGQASKLVFYA